MPISAGVAPAAGGARVIAQCDALADAWAAVPPEQAQAAIGGIRQLVNALRGHDGLFDALKAAGEAAGLTYMMPGGRRRLWENLGKSKLAPIVVQILGAFK